MLDGTEKRMLKQIGSGRIIRLFNKTPYPTQPTDVICPHFTNAAFINGCPYDCAWCLDGDTLVLTSGLQWVSIKHLKVGEEVVGVEFHGRARRLVKTPILAV